MTRWWDERKREPFYKQAKKEGYRARSAYKLQQIHGRFRLVRPGITAVDLGCSPGGWTQVLVELVGPTGHVIGVDIAHTEPVEGATVLRGDMTRPETVEAVRAQLRLANEQAQADLVVSDMSPNISGHYDRDQAESVWLATHALEFAKQVLKRGGHFVVKVFEGQDFPELLQAMQGVFDDVRRYSPQASRKSSSEVYVVGQAFKGA